MWLNNIAYEKKIAIMLISNILIQGSILEEHREFILFKEIDRRTLMIPKNSILYIDLIKGDKDV